MYEIEELMPILECRISDLNLPLRNLGVFTSDSYEYITVTAKKFSGILDIGEEIKFDYPILEYYTDEDIQKILSHFVKKLT